MSDRSQRLLIVLSVWILVYCVGCDGRTDDPAPPRRSGSASPVADAWTAAELTLLESLSIASLPPVPPQPSNRVADDRNAAELGHRLFFDTLLSGNGRVACATCHVPDLLFTDGMTTSRGIANTARNAPTLVGAAHSPWMYWDGRRDSLWAQALAPLETSAEMGSTRVAVVHHVAGDPALAALYRSAFGDLPSAATRAKFPDRGGPFGTPDEQDAWHRMDASDQRAIDEAFANIGKSLAAYERRLIPGASRFDRYVSQLLGEDPNAAVALSDEEVRGLRLFIDPGRTLCLRCHNGPMLTNQSFHQIGTASGAGGLPDFGRFLGIQAVLIDPFNCLGPFCDAKPNECRKLRFVDKTHVSEETGKFKTPTLHGVAHRALHAQRSLRDTRRSSRTLPLPPPGRCRPIGDHAARNQSRREPRTGRIPRQPRRWSQRSRPLAAGARPPDTRPSVATARRPSTRGSEQYEQPSIGAYRGLAAAAT